MTKNKKSADHVAIENEYRRWLNVMHRALGDDNTSSTELNDMGTKLFGDTFQGVFAADEIPELSTGTTAIANLDPRGQPGSHWVALTDDLVYDSFGRDGKKILSTAKLSQVDTERDPEQLIKEEDCGARSMSFLICYYLHGNKLAKFI